MIEQFSRETATFLTHPVDYLRCLQICHKYRHYTMISSRATYIRNLLIANSMAHIEGCVVECGVWRGGMVAGIADILGAEREYFLFDSFEGLPPAKDRDGEAAIAWQQNQQSPHYYDNCSADVEFAETAMARSRACHYRLIKGWFEDTLSDFVPPQKIALLRLDGDWFESTLTCLTHLSKHMAKGGIIIVDDYYYWEGCARAVHQFIANHDLPWRITQPYGLVCAITVSS